MKFLSFYALNLDMFLKWNNFDPNEWFGISIICFLFEENANKETLCWRSKVVSTLTVKLIKEHLVGFRNCVKISITLFVCYVLNVSVFLFSHICVKTMNRSVRNNSGTWIGKMPDVAIAVHRDTNDFLFIFLLKKYMPYIQICEFSKLFYVLHL